jgi:hypothetical protein
MIWLVTQACFLLRDHLPDHPQYAMWKAACGEAAVNSGDYVEVRFVNSTGLSNVVVTVRGDDTSVTWTFSEPDDPPGVVGTGIQPCNAGFSKDDEYARLALYIRSDDVMAHPTARALQPAAWRAFDRPEAQAFTEAFCRLTEIVSVKLPSGEIAEVLIHNIDERVIGWLARITKGLYYHHAGAPLPRGFRVSVGVEPQLHHLLDMPELIDKLNAQPLVDIGAGVFQYRRLVNHVKVGVSLWSMRFYEAVPFVAITWPEKS